MNFKRSLTALIEALVAFIIYTCVEVLYMRPSILRTTAVPTGMIVALATVGGLVLLIWLYRKQLKRANDWFFNSKPHWRWSNFGLALCGFAMILAVQFVFIRLAGGGISQNQAELNKYTAQSSIFKILIGLVAPVYEEIIFRGMFFNIFFTKEKPANKWLGIIVCGLVFGLAHDPQFTKYIFVYWALGSILSWVYLQTKDLRYSMIAHMLNNLIGLI
ncbi:MAG: CPBP family intramembrane metalloprotease [Lactobacillus sp.]|jgi:membrane protease YdiL (CAAX protease family)|nr:CPBP family intramembrane metalloprotease [Lactobacillus sp.]MCH3905643.1 CPBP family intramembrane metalloprotease [Lactobacillus sp.]MCH3990799.1 CPBP family intramembrane metalloprotease [Lactobacillus sp.]MCH4068485.1 CPBP family intramembrane metalloprotease [Lactobacillus sp.]MCI1304234.1 CPBP family intramembrane metalloprotease [Lactobacillus sp.]